MNWVDIEYERERFEDFAREAAQDRLAHAALQGAPIARPHAPAAPSFARRFVLWLRHFDRAVPLVKFSYED